MHSQFDYKVNCPELYIGIGTIYMDFTIYEDTGILKWKIKWKIISHKMNESNTITLVEKVLCCIKYFCISFFLFCHK